MPSHIPSLPPADLREVESAIADAEKQTSAEFVVVVAARSGAYDRAEDTFGLMLALGVVAVAWVLWQQVGPDTREWSSGTTMTMSLGAVLALFAVWTVLGAVLATRFPVLAKPFITRRQMHQEVRRRGREAFHMFRCDRTADATGVLIYVSLLERMVYITAHDAIHNKLGEEVWHPVRDALIQNIKSNVPPGRALAQAVTHCARILAPAFPAKPDDKDELANTVHFLA